MIRQLFGYTIPRFHGPLEEILSYLNLEDIYTHVIYVCKNMYIASKHSINLRELKPEEWLNIKKKASKYMLWDIISMKMHERVRYDIFEHVAKKGYEDLVLEIYECYDIDPSGRSYRNFNLSSLKVWKVKRMLKKVNSDTLNKKFAKTLNTEHQDMCNQLEKIDTQGAFEFDWSGIASADINKVLDFAVAQSKVYNAFGAIIPHAVFMLMCMHGNIEAAETLIEDPRIDPFSRQANALKLAVEHNHREIVKLLLDDPRSNNANLNSCFFSAYEFGRLEMVKLLIKDCRIDPSTTNNKALRYVRHGIDVYTNVDAAKEMYIQTIDARYGEWNYHTADINDFTDMINNVREEQTNNYITGMRSLNTNRQIYNEQVYKDIEKELLKDPRVQKKILYMPTTLADLI